MRLELTVQHAAGGSLRVWVCGCVWGGSEGKKGSDEEGNRVRETGLC